MKKIYYLAAIIILLAVAFTTMHIYNKKGIEKSVTSTISTSMDKTRGVVMQLTNRRFTFIPFYPFSEEKVSQDHIFLLLQEEFKIEKSYSEEGLKGVVTVQAWTSPDPIPGKKKIWIITQEGSEGSILYNGVTETFYKVIKHGCCAAESTGVYFNLTTGQKIFTATSDLFAIADPNTSRTRYVAFLAQTASILPERKDGRRFIGLIQYGSAGQVLDTVEIYRTDKFDGFDYYTPKIEAIYKQKRITASPLLLGTDKKRAPFSEFSMVFSYFNKDQLIIPVMHDKFDLQGVQLPEGFFVERVS